MQRNPVYYVDEARKKQKIYSDNKLAIAIGVSSSVIATIRKNKHLPSEDTILKLAELAEIPAEIALADLNVWRATSPEVKKTYEKILKFMTAACLATMLNISIDKPNGTSSVQTVSSCNDSLYIMYT